jgi:hypothetical protein
MSRGKTHREQLGAAGTARESPEKWREYMRAYRKKRREAGCCTHCGQPLPTVQPPKKESS